MFKSFKHDPVLTKGKAKDILFLFVSFLFVFYGQLRREESKWHQKKEKLLSFLSFHFQFELNSFASTQTKLSSSTISCALPKPPKALLTWALSWPKRLLRKAQH